MKTRITFQLMLLISLAACNDKKDSSLVAYWNFDTIENGFIVDQSGNHNNGKLHGGILAEGKFGMALNCAGNFVEVEHSKLWNEFENGITITAWVFRDTSTSWNCIVTRETKDNWSEYFDLGVFQNRPLFSIDANGSSFVKVELKDSLPVHQWIFLAGTFNNKVYKLFVNGKEVGSGIKKIPFQFQDANPILIAGNTNDQGKTIHDFFYGKLDELKIFNRALSSAEILTMYTKKP